MTNYFLTLKQKKKKWKISKVITNFSTIVQHWLQKTRPRMKMRETTYRNNNGVLASRMNPYQN